MAECTRKWDVVNGMSRARGRGHGAVTWYLEHVGVPRSTAYRWEQKTRWLMCEGEAEVARLRAELEARCREVERLRADGQRPRRLSRQEECWLMVEAAVLGNSDEEVATLVARAGGRHLSHQTVHAILAEWAAVARGVFEQYFAGVGSVCAVDEIFLGCQPLLLSVEPRSLLINALRLAAHRGAEAWEPVFASLGHLEGCAADGARGIATAAAGAGVSLHRDLFHLLRPARRWLEGRAAACRRQAAKARRADRSAAQARGKGAAHKRRSAAAQRTRARREADAFLEQYCRCGDLLARIRAAFDLVTADGTLQRASRARATVVEVLDTVAACEADRGFARALAALKEPEAFAHLDVLDAGIEALVCAGHDRETLAVLVAETVAWRHRDKDPVELLEGASEGTEADELEVAVIRLVDSAVRSSSPIECVNSRIRLVQVARKRLSEDFVYLLAVYHNLKAFGRGTVRQGATPAALAGIDLPTDDWLELLDLAVGASHATECLSA